LTYGYFFRQRIKKGKEAIGMRVLGIDIGFGSVKVYSEGLEYKFPTAVAYMPDDEVMEVEKVNVGGRYFVVGRDVKYVASYKIEIPGVKELVRWSGVFLKYVLDKFGVFDVVVSGLPPSAKRHVSDFEVVLRSVCGDAKVKILPQGVGILYDVVSKDETLNEVLVIDIGYNTVDCLVAEKIEGVWRKKRGITIEGFGVMKAVSLMRELFSSRMEFFKNWSVSRLVDAFEVGYVVVDGERVDLSGYKVEAVRRYEELLVGRLKAELGDDFRSIESVVLAGGGAYYVSDKYFGKRVIIPEKPEFSQARGYYLAGQFDND
jgi:hypothetical protein